jgi:hypothetical protein
VVWEADSESKHPAGLPDTVAERRRNDMGPSNHSRAWLVLVLVSITIQGVTPDTHDLASRRTCQLLYAFLADQCFEEEDASPVEVCEPDQPGALVPSRGIDRRTRHEDQETGPGASVMGTGASRSLTRHCDVARIDGLIYSLCRLTC